jgi:flagellar biosynthesis/type III secretory pathway protein FliH
MELYLSELQKVLDWMLLPPTVWRRRLIIEIEEFILEHEREDKNSLNYIIPELILRRCKKRAEDEGRAEGRTVGRAEGRTVGRAEGRTVGRAEGEAFGAALGQRRTLMLQMEARYGKLSDRATRASKRADPTQLDQLAIALLEADSLKKALNAVGLRI